MVYSEYEENFKPFIAKFSQKQISTKLKTNSTMCKYKQRAFIWMVTS